MFITLELYSVVFFSGRLVHGGTAPLAPPGDDPPPPWSYRNVVIGYPSSLILRGTARHAFGAMPLDKEPLYITPEMSGVLPTDFANRIAYSNFAMDGMNIMTPSAHFRYISRALLQLNRYILRQLPRSYNAHLDPEAFLGAFSVRLAGDGSGEEATVFCPDHWATAPPSDVHAERPPAQAAIENKIAEMSIHFGRGIPTVDSPGRSRALVEPDMDLDSVQSLESESDSEPDIENGTLNLTTLQGPYVRSMFIPGNISLSPLNVSHNARMGIRNKMYVDVRSPESLKRKYTGTVNQ